MTIKKAKSNGERAAAFGDCRLPSRFWSKAIVATSGCWLWTAGLRGGGYARFRFSGKSTVAHRVAYEALIAPIESGLALDHLCRVRRCVNPAHLEPVTARENIMRGEGLAAFNAAKTHCHAGHEFTFQNTYRDPARGVRSCRICRNETMRDLRSAKRRAA